MVRDQRMEHEREQSLKLVRSFLTIPGGAQLIPKSAVSALVAIAETPEDKMNSIALETLMEISLQNLELVAHAGGLKPVCFFSTSCPFCYFDNNISEPNKEIPPVHLIGLGGPANSIN